MADPVSVIDHQSRYAAAVLRGNVFACSNQAGVTSAAGLSGTAPVLMLSNPFGSQKNLVLWYAGAAIRVAAATAGAVWRASHTALPAATVASTVEIADNINIRNCLLGSQAKPVGKAVLAGTGVAPIGLALLGAILTGAITTAIAIPALGRWFAGSIVLGPNSAVSLQTGVASGASGWFCDFIWEEVAV